MARSTLRAEGQAISSLVDQIDEEFADAARAIYEHAGKRPGGEESTGKIVITGIGKAGIIGRKISATLASTGTPSIFLHPVEALHGDLGRVDRGDVVIVLSHSGATEEILRLLDHIKARGATLIAITGLDDSPLVRHADIVIRYGDVQEACPHGLAPTVSTTCMLALGDALALTVMQMRHFGPEDFAIFHPGGSLGRKLLTVEETMTFKGADRLHVVDQGLSLEAALIEAEKVKRRTGAMLLVDASGRLSGILTDADLRRTLATRGRENILDLPVSELMTRDPRRIHVGGLASEALAILNKYRIDELPVVDDDGRPVGVIDVQDLLGIKTVSDGED